MSEMIERVARAMAAQQWRENQPGYPEAEFVDQHWPGFVPNAYAVIKSMRKPTDAMVLAGAKYHDDNWRADHAREDTSAEAIWQDMIDVALEVSGE